MVARKRMIGRDVARPDMRVPEMTSGISGILPRAVESYRWTYDEDDIDGDIVDILRYMLIITLSFTLDIVRTHESFLGLIRQCISML